MRHPDRLRLPLLLGATLAALAACKTSERVAGGVLSATGSAIEATAQPVLDAAGAVASALEDNDHQRRARAREAGLREPRAARGLRMPRAYGVQPGQSPSVGQPRTPGAPAGVQVATSGASSLQATGRSVTFSQPDRTFTVGSPGTAAGASVTYDPVTGTWTFR